MTDKRILVVDDDKPYCKLIAGGFEKQGFEVYTAFDGPGALKVFNEKHPSVVLLDVAMPGMSGFEVAATIRKQETADEQQKTILVVMTAHARSFFVSQEFDLNIDSYLTKPMLPSEIVATVTALMK
jgi:two-component system response regulator VicR